VAVPKNKGGAGSSPALCTVKNSGINKLNWFRYFYVGRFYSQISVNLTDVRSHARVSTWVGAFWHCFRALVAP